MSIRYPWGSNITTKEGKNLLVSTNSKTIGDINNIKIIDDFAYPSDPTCSRSKSIPDNWTDIQAL